MRGGRPTVTPKRWCFLGRLPHASQGGDPFLGCGPSKTGVDDSNTGTVTVTVNPVVPVPESQTVCAPTNTSIRIHPAYTGGGGYDLTMVIKYNAYYGSVTTDGTYFYYTPPNDFVGTDRFTYRAGDGDDRISDDGRLVLSSN